MIYRVLNQYEKYLLKMKIFTDVYNVVPAMFVNWILLEAYGNASERLMKILEYGDR